MTSSPSQAVLSPHAKRTIKIIFLTLFLDLVGFSIIFPMFPSLATHYLETNPDDPLLKLIFRLIHVLMETSGTSATASTIVLFGGLLGAFYSILQFIGAPLWGALSDRIGRKPVLLISIFGLAISYVLWAFSGSFTLLVVSRMLGGIMGGNISTASAVIADVTTPETRSRGMAWIGIAFALGFIIGPALGGILTLYNPLIKHPELAAFGINPFSLAATVAALLSFINLGYVAFFFKESLSPERRAATPTSERTANPLRLFKPLPYAGTQKTNLAYFIFLLTFSGMEFTLTFLAAERLGYSPMQNAYMFIFIGFVIAFVQGGVVRRRAHQIGEAKMALSGLVTLIPGLVCLAWTDSSKMLYIGLALLAIGSAMIIPCLTSLVSLYTPLSHQGQAMGVFRSLGALARAGGPLLASLIYWRFGSTLPYYIGAAVLLLPIIFVARLPKPEADISR